MSAYVEEVSQIEGITLVSPFVKDVVRHYTSFEQITDDIDDARIYGGVHYRFDQEEAARQGRKVGRYVLRHWLRALHRHGVPRNCCLSDAKALPSTSPCTRRPPTNANTSPLTNSCFSICAFSHSRNAVNVSFGSGLPMAISPYDRS